MQSEGRNVCGGVTSFLLDGLPAGSAIALRLRALSALGGRGNWSEIVSTTTLAAMTPQAPTTLAVSFMATDVVALKWAAPPAAASDEPEYTLELARAPCARVGPTNWTRAGSAAEMPAATTRHAVQLKAGSAYCARVRASNSVGDSPWSQLLDLHTSASNATTPDRMHAPAVSPASTTLAVVWTAPGDGGSSIVRYEAQATAAKQPQLVEARCSSSGTGRGCTLTGLPSKSAFHVAVRAINWQGADSWSLPTAASTGASGAPDAPGVPAALGGGSLRVSWKAPADHGSPILQYEIQFDDWWRPSNGTGSGTGSGHRGPWSVVYSGKANQFDACSIGASLPQCKTPNDLLGSQVVNEQPGTLQAALDSVSAGDELVLDDGTYTGLVDDTLTVGKLGGKLGHPPEPTPEGLMPDTTYQMRVRARNTIGWSSWSNQGALKPAKAGACGDSSNLAIWKSHLKTLKADLTDAMIKCLLSRHLEECATGKLVAALGFSQGCSQCWAQDAVCSKAHCHMCILHPHGDACANCAIAHCQPALLTCSGVPPWAFPPTH